MLDKEQITRDAIARAQEFYNTPLLLQVGYGENHPPSFYWLVRGHPTPISRQQFVQYYDSMPTFTYSVGAEQFAWR